MAGHRRVSRAPRLSIIDLATGNQPMESHDGRFVLVFNGEIYNFIELRQALQRDGGRFRTNSDTEVILEGLPAVGQRRRRAAARDVRVRDLGSGSSGGRSVPAIALASSRSAGACVAAPSLSRRRRGLSRARRRRDDRSGGDPRPDGIRLHFRAPHRSSRASSSWSREAALSGAGAIGTEDRSLLGAAAARSGGRCRPTEDELEALLDRAVARQMVSDVPIGAFLSGGIDSSLLVAFMARHCDSPVRTFSVAFAEGDVDESPIAALVAKQFGTDHTVLQAEDVDSDALLDLLGSLDEPFCDPTLVPTYILSRMTKRHVKVALSGDGGDEVFGGYPKYLHSNQTRPCRSRLRSIDC
jgi:asparagine synthase (glutamine-hydrolysing)